jgi:adenosylcobinamide-phosphate synthase
MMKHEFFAILIALLLEQARPLARSNLVQAGLRAWTVTVRATSMRASPTTAGWPGPGGLCRRRWRLGIFWALIVHRLACAMLWNVAVLYTLGFRQFSHHFTRIRDALDAGDEHAARQALADWQQVDASELPRSEVVRHVIEYSVLAPTAMCLACCSGFGAVGPGAGAAGAVLYRMAEYLSRAGRARARAGAPPVSERLQPAARAAWYVIDWLPARLTALSFAMVGSFEGSHRRLARLCPALSQ